MLFSLTYQRVFPCKVPDHAIECSSMKGPTYGLGDLCPIKEPFNGDSNFNSIKNRTYKIGCDKEGRNLLTNKKRSNFTVEEMEVWKIEGANPITLVSMPF